MGQLAERVPVVQRKPQPVAKRSPTGELHPRSTARPQSGGAIAGRVASPVSEVVGGLPGRLRAGVEGLSGIAMDDVRVHRNSSEPAKLGALAFTRGTEIHLGPGQEQHLPHEAWHVVQQKQERAQATTRMKGMPINHSSALEREADEMGQKALDAPTRETPLASRTPRAQVVQARVKSRGAWLTASRRMSQTLYHFIGLPESYLLREDYRANLRAEPVHLMDMSKKFLLGETHGGAADALWAEATEFWPSVGKLLESGKQLPYSERADVRYSEDDPQAQNLESTHAYFVAQLLKAINAVGLLSRLDLPSAWKDSRQSVLLLIDLAVQAFGQMTPLFWQYEFFIQFHDMRKPDTTFASDALRNFAQRCMDVHFKRIQEIEVLLSGLTKVLGASPSSQAGYAGSAGAARPADLQPSLVRATESLRTMTRETIDIAGVQDKGERAKLEEHITGKGKLTDILDATNPMRERAMADNIRRVEPPLFVKLGNAHVDRVAGLVGPAAVPVPEGDNLERHTERFYVSMRLPEPRKR